MKETDPTIKALRGALARDLRADRRRMREAVDADARENATYETYETYETYGGDA